VAAAPPAAAAPAPALPQQHPWRPKAPSSPAQQRRKQCPLRRHTAAVIAAGPQGRIWYSPLVKKIAKDEGISATS